MTDYVSAPGRAYCDTATSFAWGAYVGEGTTVCTKLLVQLQRRYEGHQHDRGRISAGVMVGKGSDLGGRLFHHGHIVWRRQQSELFQWRKTCLIWSPNAGIGIPLGRPRTRRSRLVPDFRHQSGRLLDGRRQMVEVVKARRIGQTSQSCCSRRNSEPLQ